MPRLTARDLSRVANNPRCQLQAALPLLDLKEQEAFRVLTGQPYPGPRGERTAALAWGRLFESRLTQNQATRLLAAVENMLGIPAGRAWVRDLKHEVPDTQDEALRTRTGLTRAILANLLDGRPVPDLVIQPSLVLTWGGAEWGYISPDALVLDRSHRRYLPLEAKGFIGVDGLITPGERAILRLQAAVELLALQSELADLDPRVDLPRQALLVVATPYGFRPQPAALEELEAEMAAVEAALHTLARVFARLAIHGIASLKNRLLGLPTHWQDGCLVSCALAGICRTRAPQVRATLGDRVAALVGAEIDLPRLIALLSGEPPANSDESQLQEALEETIILYRWK